MNKVCACFSKKYSIQITAKCHGKNENDEMLEMVGSVYLELITTAR
jgi:hypothetical protein